MTSITAAATGANSERPLPDWLADILTVQAVAANGESTAVDAKFLAEALKVKTDALVFATKYVTPDGSADQSSGAQEFLNASAGRFGVLNPGRIFAKALQLPHNGITLRGARSVYNVAGLGTRWSLPAGANTYLMASESYANNRGWANYGPDIDGICFDGAKAGQTVAAPLVILRTTRAKLGRSVLVDNSKGGGVVVTNLDSAGGVITQTISSNELSCDVSNCEHEAIWAQNGAGGSLADLYLDGSELAFNGYCEGAAIRRPSLLVDRGAGMVAHRVRSYGKGSQNARINAAALCQISQCHWDESLLAPDANGLVENVRINSSGYSMVGYHANLHWSYRAASAGTHRHLTINGQNAQARVTHALNDYHSQNFDMEAWSYIGHANGIVMHTPGSLYRCADPAVSPNIKRAVYQ
jgi:hypothetical protein